MSPQVRQWIYTVAAVATAIIPLLVAYRVFDPATGAAWVSVVAALGAIGSGGAATAAFTLAKQRRDGTLDFTGSPAQQAVDAIQAIVDQAKNSKSDLQSVVQTASKILADNPTVGVGDNDPASANYQP